MWAKAWYKDVFLEVPWENDTDRDGWYYFPGYISAGAVVKHRLRKVLLERGFKDDVALENVSWMTQRNVRIEVKSVISEYCSVEMQVPMRRPKGAKEEDLVHVNYRQHFRGMPVRVGFEGPWMRYKVKRLISYGYSNKSVEPLADMVEEFFGFAKEFKEFVARMWDERSPLDKEEVMQPMRKGSDAGT
ncbi:hypothetical protein C1Y63_04375 [Corynebacterium sp. 13CS0277]|nr:hypothetical protein C1Y63_04375 [Corynebacterium sp. 13CS0277]